MRLYIDTFSIQSQSDMPLRPNEIVHSHLHSCQMGGFCVDELIAPRYHENSNSSIWTSSEEVLSSEPTSSSNWYPDWGNSESCANDGGEPSYMQNNPTYVTSSKEECCNKVSMIFSHILSTAKFERLTISCFCFRFSSHLSSIISGNWTTA